MFNIINGNINNVRHFDGRIDREIDTIHETVVADTDGDGIVVANTDDIPYFLDAENDSGCWEEPEYNHYPVVPPEEEWNKTTFPPKYSN